MKQFIFALACALVALSSVAQTQQGQVKTKGRRTNSKTVVTGTPLTGASVQVKGGNTVVSAQGGRFSFPIHANKFHIQSVRKQGYVLLDPDILLKSFTYSSNPLVIVMETPEQKNDDVKSAERRIRRTMQRKIDAMEDSIEALMDQYQISLQQYREAMQAVDEERKRNGELISEMAERYAQIDYDQLDQFSQHVEDLILDGNLTEAFTLLRSKGSVDDRLAVVKREEAEQAAEAAELTRRQHNLELSRTGTNAKKNDIAQDCYNYFKMFVLNMQPDSALYYIEKRASIDAHNSLWQFDAANYCQKRGLTVKADTYYQKAIQELRQLAENSPADYEPELALALNMAAMAASQQHQDNAATGYFQEAIGILDRLAESEPQVYQPYLASALNNLALHYMESDNSQQQWLALLLEALNIYWQLAQEDTRTFIPYVASTLNNMAQLHDRLRQFNQSEQAYQQALGIYSQLAQSSPETYNPDVAATLNNLSALYFRNGRDGEQFLTRALEIYRQLDQEDPQLYGPQLAAALNNLSVQYYGQGRDDEGEKACNEALNAYRRIAEYNSSAYKPELARRLFDHAIRLYQDERFEQSEPLFKESLSLYRDLMKLNPDAYQAEVPKVLRNLATAYDKMNRLADGEKAYQEELAINQELALQEPTRYNADVARSYGNLSNHALLMKDFDRAIDLANKGLAIDDSKLFIRANLAAAYLFAGKTALAEEIYKHYKPQLHDVFLDDLQQFSSLGIIPKERLADVERIRRLLAQ